MDKRKGFLNVSVSIISKIILLFAALYVRRLLIQQIGNDVNGLNSLYTSIVGMLAVAELGVGSAIVFSMYSPIVAGSTRKVAALYCLYKKWYHVIGLVVFCAGISIMPFLPRFIKDYEILSVDVYINYFLTLISVVLSYLYSAKTSLIEAHKENYITTGILTVSNLVRYALQALTIHIWSSFTLFIICKIIGTFLIWTLTEIVVRQRYQEIVSLKAAVDEETKAELSRNVKAMFMHKTGTILVNSVDNVIISSYIGVVALGKFNNYTYIVGVMAGILSLFFSPLTSVVGHLYVVGESSQTKRYFDRFYCSNYIIGVVFFLGYYAVIDFVIQLCFGSNLELSRSIAFIITLNKFTLYMRSASLLFRDASGTFYNDRWKPVAEGVVNLGLSLLFVNIFPDNMRIVGVIAATIITTLFSVCSTNHFFLKFALQSP